MEARPESAGYRIAKFARRHAAATIAAGLAVVSLLAGTSVALWQAREASAERARAERHSAAVRTLSTTYVGDVYDAIVQIPGSTAARKLLVDRSLEYLTALERDAGDSVELQRDLAKAWERLGDVQGAFLKASLGETQLAIESYRRALAIRERILEREPTLEHRLDLLWSQADLSTALLERDAFDEARGLIDASLRNARDVVAAGASGADLRAAMQAYVNHGWLERADGRTESAISSLEKALTLAEQVAAASSEDPASRHGVAIALGRIGEAYVLGAGQPERALPYYRRAAVILDELTASSPSNVDFARARSFTHLTIGDLLTLTGRPEEALREIEPELLALDRALQADPADGLAPIAYGAALNYAGEARLRLGRYAAADADFAAAARYLPPDLVASGAHLAVVHGQALAGRARALAGLAASGGPGAAAQRAQARDFARRAIAVLEPISKGGNVELEAQRLLQEARRALDAPTARATVAGDSTDVGTAVRR